MWAVKKFLDFKTYCVLTIFFSVALVSGNVSVSYGDEVRGVTDKSVKIGLMGDLTGPIADVWIPCFNGARSFFKMVNDKGGVHGRKIKVIMEDDRFTIPLALSGFKKLVYKDKVFVLQGASGTGGTAAIIPIAEKKKIPLIAASGDKRFFIPARRYIFSPIPWHEDQAKLFTEYVFNDMKLKNPSIAFMYPDVGTGKDARDAIRELVKVYPVKEYKEKAFSLAALDYTSEAIILKRLNPDIIYFFGFVGDTSLFLRARARTGLSAPIILAQWACADKTLEIAGKAASGLLGINCFGAWDDDSPGAKQLRKASLAYDPNVSRWDSSFFQGWFAGMLFYEGLKNAGRELTREAFVKGLESINLDTQGICGVVSFSPTDHKSIETARFLKADIDKKRFFSITDWRKPKKYDF